MYLVHNLFGFCLHSFLSVFSISPFDLSQHFHQTYFASALALSLQCPGDSCMIQGPALSRPLSKASGVPKFNFGAEQCCHLCAQGTFTLSWVNFSKTWQLQCVFLISIYYSILSFNQFTFFPCSQPCCRMEAWFQVKWSTWFDSCFLYTEWSNASLFHPSQSALDTGTPSSIIISETNLLSIQNQFNFTTDIIA